MLRPRRPVLGAPRRVRGRPLHGRPDNPAALADRVPRCLVRAPRALAARKARAVPTRARKAGRLAPAPRGRVLPVRQLLGSAARARVRGPATTRSARRRPAWALLRQAAPDLTVATAVRVPARLARPVLARAVQAAAALADLVPPEAVREPARTATAVRGRAVPVRAR